MILVITRPAALRTKRNTCTGRLVPMGVRNGLFIGEGRYRKNVKQFCARYGTKGVFTYSKSALVR